MVKIASGIPLNENERKAANLEEDTEEVIKDLYKNILDIESLSEVDAGSLLNLLQPDSFYNNIKKKIKQVRADDENTPRINNWRLKTCHQFNY